MDPDREVDFVLHDCFFAVGQAVQTQKRLSYDVIVWWRRRYRDMFLRTLRSSEQAWPADRTRLTAVGRYLGQRAVHHAGDRSEIDIECAAKASADVEQGCRMNAIRQGVIRSTRSVS